MSVWCPICYEMKSIEEAVQLIPCLHTFCKRCMKEATKQSSVCPVAHCYSTSSAPEVMTSTCEGEFCHQKLNPGADILRTTCQHDVCLHCYEMAARKGNMACPASGCEAMMVDEEDMICEGPCKQPLQHDKTIVIPCCGAKMCDECGPKWTGGRDFCDAGKCIVRDFGTKRMRALDVVRQPCQGKANCEGEVLRNFPSDLECEHEVCLSCISTMLDECEKSGKAPVCPSKLCGLPYRCESVLALVAQYPERKAYFSQFILEANFSMQTLRDDAVMNVLHGDLATMLGQKFSLKVGQCEEEDSEMPMEFVREGNLGDLIREIRGVLKILPTDKIYGYYRVEGDKKMKLEVSQKTIGSSCAALGISESTVILVNTKGIVVKRNK